MRADSESAQKIYLEKFTCISDQKIRSKFVDQCNQISTGKFPGPLAAVFLSELYAYQFAVAIKPKCYY